MNGHDFLGFFWGKYTTKNIGDYPINGQKKVFLRTFGWQYVTVAMDGIGAVKTVK